MSPQRPTAFTPHAWRVRKMFDRIARRYSLVNSLISFGRDGYWRRQAVQLADVQPGDRLLDVCCGPGDLADAFAAAALPPETIVACDFSSAMLAEADRRQARRRVPLQLVQADATALPFADGGFELVSCAFGLRNLADPVGGLAEFARLLAPGGRAVVLEFALPPGRVFRAVFTLYFHLVLPLLGGLMTGQPAAYRYLPRSVETFLSPGRIADILKQVGLADVRQRRLTFGIAVVTVGRKPRVGQAGLQ